MDLQIEIRVIHNGFVHNIFSDAFKCCRENMQRDRNGQIVLLNRLASCSITLCVSLPLFCV